MNCPLCRSQDFRVTESRSREEILQLWAVVGKPLPEQLLSGYPDQIDLLVCQSCGLRFHDPKLAGGGDFYEAIDAGSGYYVGSRPEFIYALRRARTNAATSVLDVGCGAGLFLDQAKAEGLRTFGMELNQTAASLAHNKGHRVFSDLLTSQFTENCAERFDLITFFQVVEHLPEPVAVLIQAKKLLANDGQIIISVPNFSGLGCLFSTEPHQWPPHHLTRWRRRDLYHLGSALGMRTSAVSGDVLYGGALRVFLNLEYRLRRHIGKPTGWVSPRTARIASFLYSKFGLKYIFRSSGLSLYAVYRKD